MSELARHVIEGVVMDDSDGIDRLCAGMVESMTEFDWETPGPHRLPDHLREGLREWARELRAWDRATREAP